MPAHLYHQHRHPCVRRPSARTYSWLTRPSQEIVPISQDHCHNNVPVSQDHYHNNVVVSQDHHIQNVPTPQDHQLRYTWRKSVKPTSTHHHHHSKGSNQQPDMTVSNLIIGSQSETTIDQLLQYLVAINGHSTSNPRCNTSPCNTKQHHQLTAINIFLPNIPQLQHRGRHNHIW